MNKIKYITLGVLLAGTTLLLNHLLQLDLPKQQNNGAEIAQHDTRDASNGQQAEETLNEGTSPSLRDRVLGRREMGSEAGEDHEKSNHSSGNSLSQLPSGSPSLAQSPKSEGASEQGSGEVPAVETKAIDEIVVPDFSHLEKAILETDGQSFIAQTNPPRLIKIPDPPKLDRNWSNKNGEMSTSTHQNADQLQLPPSHNITPQYPAPSVASGTRTGSRSNRSYSRKTGIPFGLNQKARSELVEVHHRSDQVKPATTNFLDHKTEVGDSLQSLSDRYYGRPDFYLDIYIANQDKLVNPSTLPPGMVIKIPIFQE